ncbi:MAG: hypothetical protein NDJ89_10385 [Oligoflexia bacterium]|nr:hypothetical protein [Oligoflexia bacterium]
MRIFRLGWVLAFVFTGAPVAAATIPLDPGQFADPTALLDAEVVPALVKTIGLATDHRAYESATPYGMKGVDIGLEASLVKLPEDFQRALATAGAAGSSQAPFLPVPRLNIHKGIAQNLDLGFSILWLQGLRLYGYEAKLAVAQPEEGLTWALRLSLTHANFSAENGVKLQLLTNTVTPGLLVSRKLDFADPYLGVAYQYAIGKLILTVPVADPAPEYSMTGKGGGFLAFTGVALKLPGMGFKLSLEGSYSSASASALGAKFGLSF